MLLHPGEGGIRFLGRAGRGGRSRRGQHLTETRAAIERLVGPAAQAFQHQLRRAQTGLAGGVLLQHLPGLTGQGALLGQALPLQSAQPLCPGRLDAARHVPLAVAFRLLDPEHALLMVAAGVIPTAEPGGINRPGFLGKLLIKGGHRLPLAPLQGEPAGAGFLQEDFLPGSKLGQGAAETLKEAGGVGDGQVHRRRVIRSHF